MITTSTPARGSVRAPGFLHAVRGPAGGGDARLAAGGAAADQRSRWRLTLAAVLCGVGGGRRGLASARAWFVAFVVGVALVVCAAPAWAAASPSPIPTCTSSIPNCTPPPLLNDSELIASRLGPERPYAATPGQRAALHYFERQAVENTLRDHDLPAGDAAAVQSWGRADALAQLFGLVVAASHASHPTLDQREVVAWLTAVMHRRAKAEADHAAWEFLKWAGLLPGDRPIPAQSTLVTLLDKVDRGALKPVEYDRTGTSGFCKWQPPAPFQAEYTGNVSTPPSKSTAQSWCYPPYRCVSLIGCNDNQPSYDEFVKYGAADVENGRANQTEFALLTAQQVRALLFGYAAAGAGVALSGAVGATLVAGFFVKAFLASAVGPFVWLGVAKTALAWSAAGAVVAAVIAAVAIATVEGIRVVHAAKVPGQLSSLITRAASGEPVSRTLAGMFAVFTGAAVPTPSLKACNNRAPVPVGVGTAIPAPCLNAPPIPARTADDPRFLITPRGAAQATRSDTLSWTDQFSSGSASLTTQHTARLSGHWFVTQMTDATGNPAPTVTATADSLSLSIHYVGWDQKGRTAWLVHKADGPYRFLIVPDGSEVLPSTCLAQGLCTLSDHIDYIRKDSLSAPTVRDYSAIVVPAVPTYNAVSAGGFHSCAITTEGTVACWGADNLRQSSAPSGTFKAISAGQYFTCGIRTDGALACWGSNIGGESSPPSGAFKAISAGYGHACAIRTDDTIACWGSNNQRESSPPSGAFKAISAGQSHTCAIRTDDTAVCWGLLTAGQLSSPSGHFKAITTGRDHTCAIRTDDTVHCWGSNEAGKASPPAGHFKAISAGTIHTCGIRTDDAIACWGVNVPGHPSPPSGTFKAISAGPAHNCAIRTNNTVVCWGSNFDGQSTPPK